MKRYLLNYDSNWADEFNISGVYVMSENEYNLFNKSLEKLRSDFKNFEFYFGTNEFMQYECFEDVENAFEIHEISEEEYQTLSKFDLMNLGFASNFVSAVIDTTY